MKEKEINIEVDIEKLKIKVQYRFLRLILMICDAAEAASKSLKQTAQSIDDLINKIVALSDSQFINSNITFREIETIKKVVKRKLMNIYHLRVEYQNRE